MIINRFRIYLFLLIFPVLIYSMEGQKKHVPLVKMVSSPLEMPINSLAYEIIKIYDREGYEKMDQYIKNLKLPVDVIYLELFPYVATSFNRADIFTNKLLSLYQSSKGKSGIISYFNKFDYETRVRIAKSLIKELTNLNYYDIKSDLNQLVILENNQVQHPFKDAITNLLKLLLKRESTKFHDEIINILKNERHRIAIIQIPVIDHQDSIEKNISVKWDSNNNRMKITTSGQSNDKELREQARNFWGKFFDFKRYLLKKIGELIETVLIA